MTTSIANLTRMAEVTAAACVESEAEGAFELMPRPLPSDGFAASLLFQEMANDMTELSSSAPSLLHTAIFEGLVPVKLCAIAAIRLCGHEILSAVLKIVRLSKPRGGKLSGVRMASIRWMAVVLLGLMAERAGPAVGTLRRRLKRERCPETRVAIVWALGQIAPEAPEVRQALAAAIENDPNNDVQWAARRALVEHETNNLPVKIPEPYRPFSLN